MKIRTYTTTEIIKALKVPFYRLEHLIRVGKVTPLNRGRGVERRFNSSEYEKARRLLAEPADLQNG